MTCSYDYDLPSTFNASRRKLRQNVIETNKVNHDILYWKLDAATLRCRPIFSLKVFSLKAGCAI